MAWQYTPIIWPLVVAGLLSILVAIGCWRRRGIAGATSLALFMVAAAVWSLGYALELASTTLAAMTWWIKVQTVGVVLTPITWLLYVLQYVGWGRWLTRRNVALMSVPSVVGLLLVWTNDSHHWISRNPHLVSNGILVMYEADRTAGFWVGWVYGCVVAFFSVFLVIRMLLVTRSTGLYLRQLITMLVGALFPCAAALLTMAGVGGDVNLTPFAFVLTGLFLFLGLGRFRLLRIAPAANHAVFQSISDGVLVLDLQDRVVNLNPSAARMIGRSLAEVVGQPAADVLGIPGERLQRASDGAQLTEVVFGLRGEQRRYDLRLSPVVNQTGRLTGRLVVLRDVTERIGAEREARRRADTLAALHETALDLAQQRALPDLFRAIVSRAMTLLAANGGAVYYYRPATDDLELVFDYSPRTDDTGAVLKRGEGLSGKVLESGRPLIVDRYDSWEGRSDQFELGGFDAIVAVPIRWGDRLLGVLNVLDDAPRSFTPEDVEVLERFAPLAAAALEQARLLESSERRLREAETLHQAGAAIAGTLSLDETLTRILDQLHRVLPCDSASVHLLREGYLEIVAARGFDDPVRVIGLRFAVPGDDVATAVVERREPMVLSDSPAAYPTVAGLSHVRSWLGMPLIVRDRVIGMMAMDSVEPGHFTQEHVRLVNPYANQVAVAIENAQLYEASQNRLTGMRSLLESSRNVTSSLELDQVLTRVIQAAIAAIGPAQKGTLHLYDETSGDLVVRASVGFGQDTLAAVRLKPGEGYAGWVFQHRIPLCLGDTQSDSRTKHYDHLEIQQAISALCVPLLVRDRAIGTLSLDNVSQYHAFSAEHLDLLAIFAGQAANAIDNARLYAETQRQLEEQIALRESGAVITSALDPQTVLARIAEQMGRAIDATSTYILDYDPNTKQATVLTEYFGPEACPEERVSDLGVVYNVEELDFMQRMEAGLHDHAHVDDPALAEDQRLHLLGYGAKTVLYVPLRVRGQLSGFVELWDSRRRREFTPAEIALCQGIAQQAAVAQDNSRLYDQAQRRAAERGVLYDTVTAMASSVRLDEVFGRTVDALYQALSPDTVAILLGEPGTDELIVWAWHAAGSATSSAVSRRADEGAGGWTWPSGEPLLLADVRGDPRYQPFAADALSALCVPLRIGQRVIGALDLESQRLGAFDDDALRLLSIVSGHLAVVVENARLVEGLEEEVAARTAEIRAEKEKSDTILRNVGDAIAMFDLDLRIRYTNPAFTGLTGYSTEEALGQDIHLLTGGAMTEQDRRLLEAALERGENWQGEMAVTRSDGRVYDALLSLAAIRDGTGQLMGFVSSHSDISGRKELDRARSHFMTHVSHELRTPITTLKLYASLLQREPRPAKVESYFRVIEHEANRLWHLVEDILEATRLDGGDVVTAWRPIVFGTLMSDALVAFYGRARAAGLALRIGPLPPDLPAVNGDQARLGQALSELLENAITFTPAGGKIVVSVEQRSVEDQTWVTVSVQDTGPGIALEEQSFIFDRFYRGSLAESGHVPGTGLGLSRAWLIMQAHGGRVTVDSAPGEGSTFSLWLRPG